jgi:hypothetical protein
MKILFLPLFKYNLIQLRFLLRNLTRFHHEHLVLILKHENTSWLVIVALGSIESPLSYVLKCSKLIAVNKGNERDRLLITLKLMNCVALTIHIIVPYINFMHHTAYVLTLLVWRMR